MKDIIIAEMKDKLIDLGEMDFLEYLQKIYKVDLQPRKSKGWK